MQESGTFSIILADDHGIVREGIAALCGTHPELRVVGQCADGLAAYEMILSLRPDFAILDMNMPKLSGLEVIRKLRAEGCRTKLLILSIARDDETVMGALHAGADAYLLKDGPARHLLDAVNYIRDGGVYISPLLKAARAFGEPQKAEAPDPLACLSQREREVFSHLVNGLRPKDIAELLEISPKTVDTYRVSLMRKLNVRDLVGLIKFAIEAKLISA